MTYITLDFLTVTNSEKTSFEICPAGKSSLLAAIGNRELPIPEHIDIFHLKREVSASDKTAIQCVMEVDQERIKLEREAEELAVKGSDGACNS